MRERPGVRGHRIQLCFNQLLSRTRAEPRFSPFSGAYLAKFVEDPLDIFPPEWRQKTLAFDDAARWAGEILAARRAAKA